MFGKIYKELVTIRKELQSMNTKIEINSIMPKKDIDEIAVGILRSVCENRNR